jgi:chromosome segregation ATPase
MPPKSSNKKKSTTKPSYFEGLKTEWNLFWETILGEDELSEEGEKETKDPFVTGKLEVLSLDQIKAITKALSSDRKLLNQRLEALNKEIEENTEKVESLKLVGGDPEEAHRRIAELTDLGQNLSEQLNRINERLKLARSREDSIKKSAREL